MAALARGEHVAPVYIGVLALAAFTFVYVLYVAWRIEKVPRIPQHVLDQSNLAAARFWLRPGTPAERQERKQAGTEQFVSILPALRDALNRGMRGEVPYVAERDTPLGEALAYVVLGTWGNEFTDSIEAMFTADGPNSLGEFHQRAFDGKVRVWGRFARNDVYREIPSNFWSDHRVDGGALLNGHARTWGHDAVTYIDLMVSQAEIEREWPHA